MGPNFVRISNVVGEVDILRKLDYTRCFPSSSLGNFCMRTTWIEHSQVPWAPLRRARFALALSPGGTAVLVVSVRYKTRGSYPRVARM
jgi:hypothetical protein